MNQAVFDDKADGGRRIASGTEAMYSALGAPHADRGQSRLLRWRTELEMPLDELPQAKTQPAGSPGPNPDGQPEPTGIIFDVKRYAIHDGPGIRTTVFLKGCPLRCLWCHNPESWEQTPERAFRANLCARCGRCIDACPAEAISWSDEGISTDAAKCVLCGNCARACPAGAREIVGRRVTVAELVAEIERDVIFYDESGGGVTVSGGEPLMQPDFLGRLLSQCKAREIHTALDTSCHGPWPLIAELCPYVDLFLCDLKHMDPLAHEHVTGVSNEGILENLRRLAESQKRTIIRIPIIPGFNDAEENIRATGEFVRSLDGVRRIDVLPYNEAVRAKQTRLAREYNLLEVEPPSDEQIRSIAATLRSFGLTVKIGG